MNIPTDQSFRDIQVFSGTNSMIVENSKFFNSSIRDNMSNFILKSPKTNLSQKHLSTFLQKSDILVEKQNREDLINYIPEKCINEDEYFNLKSLLDEIK